MTASVKGSEALVSAWALSAAVARLAGCPFATLADGDLLEIIRQAEQARRQLEALDSVLIAERDERTAGQRMHDAFRSVPKLALRAGELPAAGGVPATVLITMTAEQFESGTGLASTSFGQPLQVDQALRTADQAAIAWIMHNSKGGILNYGTSRWVASDKQTLALIARDQGCAFPGCTDPPEWTERHHIVPWRQGGRTDLDNLCLLCDFHHDRIDTGGWRITMRDGMPWFIPPNWIGPDQRPRQKVRPCLLPMRVSPPDCPNAPATRYVSPPGRTAAS